MGRSRDHPQPAARVGGGAAHDPGDPPLRVHPAPGPRQPTAGVGRRPPSRPPGKSYRMKLCGEVRARRRPKGAFCTRGQDIAAPAPGQQRSAARSTPGWPRRLDVVNSTPKSSRQRWARPMGFFSASCAHQLSKKSSCCRNSTWTFGGSMVTPAASWTGSLGLGGVSAPSAHAGVPTRSRGCSPRRNFRALLLHTHFWIWCLVYFLMSTQMTSSLEKKCLEHFHE